MLRYFVCERQSAAIAVLQDLRTHTGTDVESESELQGRRRSPSMSRLLKYTNTMEGFVTFSVLKKGIVLVGER